MDCNPFDFNLRRDRAGSSRSGSKCSRADRGTSLENAPKAHKRGEDDSSARGSEEGEISVQAVQPVTGSGLQRARDVEAHIRAFHGDFDDQTVYEYISSGCFDSLHFASLYVNGDVARVVVDGVQVETAVGAWASLWSGWDADLSRMPVDARFDMPSIRDKSEVVYCRQLV